MNPYTYETLLSDIAALRRTYPFIETGYIGRSALGGVIPYIRLGVGLKEVCYCAAFHANEWLTAPVLMRFAENFLRAYAANGLIQNFSARAIFRDVSIYIVPMVNPDGVDLVTGAYAPGSTLYNAARNIAARFPDIPFPNGWKANLDGTDLNRQFPANWDDAKALANATGFTVPAPRDYPGEFPLSAPEARAVYNFTRAHRFSLVLSYHSQGRVIFWRYLNYFPQGSLDIARKLADASGYDLEDSPYSYAGYKDWFIQDYNRPGFTIEVGLGENPLPVEQFPQIYRENEPVLVLAALLAA